MLHHSVVFLEIFCWFNQLCWAKINYSTYNFRSISFIFGCLRQHTSVRWDKHSSSDLDDRQMAGEDHLKITI